MTAPDRVLELANAQEAQGRANELDMFLARQPMLFEPNIALSFHLLRYQERLKPRVTTRR